MRSSRRPRLASPVVAGRCGGRKVERAPDQEPILLKFKWFLLFGLMFVSSPITSN